MPLLLVWFSKILNLAKKNIAILGGSTTSEIKNVLELFLLNNGIKPDFYESEYNKYYEDALFGNDTLDKFNPVIVYIHTPWNFPMAIPKAAPAKTGDLVNTQSARLERGIRSMQASKTAMLHFSIH